jgi:hypothetical protein
MEKEGSTDETAYVLPKKRGKVVCIHDWVAAAILQKYVITLHLIL